MSTSPVKFQNPFSTLTRTEWIIWIFSLCAVTLGFLFSEQKDPLSLVASLVGVTALIFVCKGNVLGQMLTILFSILYGIVSWQTRYYGEMITYLCMSAPAALFATVSWLCHPYKDKKDEVTIAHLSTKAWIILLSVTLPVTVLFYFLLQWLGTESLYVSTLSVATSFVAAGLTFLRSPYYGLGYAVNDLVLIVLWLLASFKEPKYLPMLLCFGAFLVNDLYGFFNWRRIRRRQENG